MARHNRFSFLVGTVFLVLLAGGVVTTAVMLRSSGTLRQRVHFEVAFADVAGLRPGAPVRLAGYEIGIVDSVRVSRAGAHHVAVLAIVDHPSYRHWIRDDSKFQIVAANLLGGKHVEISFGEHGTPLAAGARVVGESPVGFEAILTDLRETVRHTASIGARMSKALAAADADGNGLAVTLVKLQEGISNLAGVSDELKSLIQRDSRDPESLRGTLADLRRASAAAAAMMGELREGLRGEDGEPRKLAAIVENLEKTAANSSQVTEQLKAMLGGPGSKPVDVRKTMVDLQASASNLKEITESTKSMIETMRKLYPPNWFK